MGTALRRNPAGTGLLQLRPRAVRLDGTAGTYISTADAASLDILTDIDLRIAVLLDTTRPAADMVLMAKEQTTTTRSWRFYFATTGALVFAPCADGSTIAGVGSDAVLAASVFTLLGLKATWRDSDNRLQFFTKSLTRGPEIVTDSGWTQLGGDRTASAAGLFSGTSQVSFGARLLGQNDRATTSIRAAVIKDGIDGTTVFNADFTRLSFGATAFTESTGKVVTLNGTAHVRAA